MNKKPFKKINEKRKIKLLNNDIDFFENETSLFEEESEYYSSEDISDDEKEELGEDYDVQEEDEDEEKEEIEEREIPKKKVSDKEKFYVDPKEFDEQIMNYYDSNVMTNELASMISKISNKLSYASNFINYSYREEMVGDGIIRMMKALIAKKYDRVKGTNPFSYFTRIAFNAFRNRIKKEKHIHETHEKYQREFLMMSESFNNFSKNKSTKTIQSKNLNY
jgi:hypothetical protein